MNSVLSSAVAPMVAPASANARGRALVPLAALCAVAVCDHAVAQAQNAVYRANRSFYTSMWTTNPPEYTTTGQTVAAGTMHWRAFLDQTNQRREPRRVTGIGTWWQPSDLTGSFPQTISTPEFRIYPTTLDGSGLVIPDVTVPPLLTVPPMPMTINTGNSFMSVTVAIAPTPINAVDFAICGVYPANASSTSPGFFGFLPSGANEAYTLSQSYFGFVYPNGGAITHFGLGGARSSIWYTEEQPTLNVRANWAITDAHNQGNHLINAFGDQTYFGPITDPAWPGWSDTRRQTRLGWTVFAQGRDGDIPLTLLNFGPRFGSGVPFLGQMFEIDLTSPVLGILGQIMPAVTGGRSDVEIPFVTSPRPTLGGFYVGLECLLLDPFTFQFTGTTQSGWVKM